MRITFEFSPHELRDILVNAVKENVPEGEYFSAVSMPERNVIKLSMRMIHPEEKRDDD